MRPSLGDLLQRCRRSGLSPASSFCCILTPGATRKWGWQVALGEESRHHACAILWSRIQNQRPWPSLHPWKRSLHSLLQSKSCGGASSTKEEELEILGKTDQRHLQAELIKRAKQAVRAPPPSALPWAPPLHCFPAPRRSGEESDAAPGPAAERRARGRLPAAGGLRALLRGEGALASALPCVFRILTTRPWCPCFLHGSAVVPW